MSSPTSKAWRSPPQRHDEEYAEANGLSNAELHDLRRTPADQLTLEQRQQLSELRNLIDAPTPETALLKVVPVDSIWKYMNGEWGDAVRGFVARDGDLNPWVGLDRIVADARLDCPDSDYLRPGVDSYGFIEFRTDDADLLDAPLSPEFGGKETHDAPFTGSGFLGNEDDVWRPEYKASGPLKMSSGAKLWIHGPDGPRLVGMYIDGHGFFTRGSW